MRTNKEGGALPAAIVSFAVRELEQWLETLPATREITPAEVAEAARYFVGWLGAGAPPVADAAAAQPSRAVLELLREARSCLGLGLRELEGSADCVVGHLDPEVLKAAGAEGPDSFVVGPGLKDTGPITVVGSFAPGVDWVPASAGASAGVGGMIADPAPVRDEAYEGSILEAREAIEAVRATPVHYKPFADLERRSAVPDSFEASARRGEILAAVAELEAAHAAAVVADSEGRTAEDAYWSAKARASEAWGKARDAKARLFDLATGKRRDPA
jgi:hypothetical protein